MARKFSKRMDDRLDTRTNKNSPFPTSGVRGVNKKDHDQNYSVPTASCKRTRMGLSLSCCRNKTRNTTLAKDACMLPIENVLWP